jgi:hypothetical protein
MPAASSHIDGGHERVAILTRIQNPAPLQRKFKRISHLDPRRANDGNRLSRREAAVR